MAVRGMDLKPIGWPQLCAVSRDLLQVEPSMPDSEWKARLKDRLARLQFEQPSPEQIAKALDATTRAYERTHGRRQVDIPNATEPIPFRQEDPPWLGTPRGHGGATSMQELLENIRRYRASAE